MVEEAFLHVFVAKSDEGFWKDGRCVLLVVLYLLGKIVRKVVQGDELQRGLCTCKVSQK